LAEIAKMMITMKIMRKMKNSTLETAPRATPVKPSAPGDERDQQADQRPFQKRRIPPD
jgi:hypothetical protein